MTCNIVGRQVQQWNTSFSWTSSKSQ